MIYRTREKSAESSAKVQKILFEIKYYIQGYTESSQINSDDSEFKNGKYVFSPQKAPVSITKALVNGMLVDW